MRNDTLKALNPETASGGSLIPVLGSIMTKVAASLLLATVVTLEAGCSTFEHERSQFFQRYTPADPVAFQIEIARLRSELTLLHSQGEEREALRAAADLGGMLISARKEREAKALLEHTGREARRLRANDALGWVLLYLATANQYLGFSSEALSQFDEALRLATENGDRELQHYAYHHRGRLRAELRDIDGARSDFGYALAIRMALRDQAREQSTRRALRVLGSDTTWQQSR